MGKDMGKNVYSDNDKIYSELISDLKNLPKVKAPDNFEYNLMIKIQNEDFSEKKERSPSRLLYWILTPSSALAAAVLLFVFIVNPVNSLDENLLEANPQILSSINTESVLEHEDGYRTVVKQNDAIDRERIEYHFDKSRSVAVDNFIGSAPMKSSASGNYYNVGGTQSRRVSFGGFEYIGNLKQKDLIDLKAKRDSLINATRQK